MYDDVKPLVTALITAAVTLLGIFVPLAAGWMRSYFAVKENAAMNQTVTASASREAAMLLSQSADLMTVSIGSPLLASLAQDLLTHYPDYCDKLGLDIERAQRLILGEAHKLYNTGLVPVPSVSASVVQTTTAISTTVPGGA